MGALAVAGRHRVGTGNDDNGTKAINDLPYNVWAANASMC